MVRSHAKNNTTQSTLTYYERSLLRREGAARRLGVDSMKPLDACNLCLSRAVSGAACARGHLYCRECALAHLLAQKAGIDAQRREIERWAADDEARKRDAREQARRRVIGDFERGMGLGSARIGGGGGGSGAAGPSAKSAAATSTAAGSTSAPAPAVAGKPVLADEIERVAAEAEERAMRAIEAELAAGRKSKLAAFWLPSNAPEAPLGPVKDVKLQTLCHVGAHPHPLTRKSLVPVIFTYPGASTKPACPSCTRELSNATTAILLTSRSPAVAPDAAVDGAAEPEVERPKKKSKKVKEAEPVCGHVVCKTCADTVVRPSGRCCVCEAAVGEGDMIPLGKEGTGFAAAGGAEVKKSVTTFRV
ncbi:hypothetical protein Q5752_002510 [Cryptotrichosporon argae]